MAELSLTFAETAFLLWETQSPNHEFAEHFNKLYDLSLSREEDLNLSDGSTCPFFLYYDEPHVLLYALIDNPLQGMMADFARYDKIMIINGRDAFERQQDIYRDYATHSFPPAADNLLQMQRYELLQEARRNIFTVHYFDYRFSEEVRQRSREELAIVRRTGAAESTGAVSSRARSIPIPQSSLLTAVRNAQSAKMRNVLNGIYLVFEDILHAMETPIYQYGEEDNLL